MAEGLTSRVVFELVNEGRLFIVLTGEHDIDDDDFDEQLAALAALPSHGPGCSVLIVSDGARPSHAQRQRLTQVAKQQHINVAVVSPSVTVRFFVSAVALVNRYVRFFPPEELSSAFDYLGTNGPDRAAAQAALARLREQAQLPRTGPIQARN